MSPLADLMPPAARAWTYAIISALIAGWGIWETSQHDWITFALGLLAASALAMANGNTPRRTDDTPRHGR